jgi:cysteine synthase
MRSLFRVDSIGGDGRVHGVKLFVNIEAFDPLRSVKDRPALGVIEAAE